MAELKKLQLFLVIAGLVTAPVGTYYKAMGDIRADYIRRDEVEMKMDAMNKKLDRLIEEVFLMRGRLERNR